MLRPRADPRNPQGKPRTTARIVAQLDARKAGGIGAVHDRRRGGSVTPVPEDGLEPAQWLRLDALERDEEAFAASLALEVDSTSKVSMPRTTTRKPSQPSMMLALTNPRAVT